MQIYIKKENHIGSAVNEILRYRQKRLTTLYNRINTYWNMNSVIREFSLKVLPCDLNIAIWNTHSSMTNILLKYEK